MRIWSENTNLVRLKFPVESIANGSSNVRWSNEIPLLLPNPSLQQGGEICNNTLCVILRFSLEKGKFLIDRIHLRPNVVLLVVLLDHLKRLGFVYFQIQYRYFMNLDLCTYSLIQNLCLYLCAHIYTDRDETVKAIIRIFLQ